MARHATPDGAHPPAVGRAAARRHSRALAVLATALTLIALAGCWAGTRHGGAGGKLDPPNANRRPNVAGGALPSSKEFRSGVAGGALFGGDVPLAFEEPYIGRKLAIVRDYYRIGEHFPNVQDQQLMSDGTTLLVSLDSVPGAGSTYADIIGGRQDAAIRAFLSEVERAAVRYRLPAIYLTFEHEADTVHHNALGTPSDFIRAWDHVHNLASSMHLDWNQGGRLHWVWILTSGAFRADVATWYWPGANMVDIVGADGYNTGGCRLVAPGTNLVINGNQEVRPAVLFGPVVSFAETHGGLPVFIPEWGSVPYTSPDLQAQYIEQMGAYVARNHSIAAALYWNNHGHANGCDYSIDRYPASIRALAILGQSPAFQGRLVAK